MKRIWISGAGGFLGRSLAMYLLNSGMYRVLAMTSHPEKLSEAAGNNKNLEILAPDAILTAEETGGDILINCAFPRNTGGGETAQGLFYVSSVLKAAAEAGFAGIINISSQSVYDETRQSPAREEDPLSLNSVYAVGKYASELLTSAYAAGIPCTNIRLSSLIGPGFDQRVTNRMVKRAISDHSLHALEDGQIFGFLDVEDAVRGIAGLLETSPERWKTVYNLGNGRGCTLKEIAETVRDVLSSEYGIAVSLTVEPGEKRSNTCVSGELLRRDTGFVPSVDLRESIRRICAAEALKQ